jgi:hypothetical protein
MIQQLQLLCCNGATMPSNYLAQAGVIYDNNASIEAQLEKSLLRSITLPFVDYQSWFEKKNRYPILPRALWYNS